MKNLLTTLILLIPFAVLGQKGLPKIYNKDYSMYDTAILVHARGTMHIKAYRYIDYNGQLRWRYQDTISRVIPAVVYYHKGWDKKRRKSYLYCSASEFNTEFIYGESSAKYYLNGKEVKFVNIIPDKSYITGYSILSK